MNEKCNGDLAHGFAPEMWWFLGLFLASGCNGGMLDPIVDDGVASVDADTDADADTDTDTNADTDADSDTGGENDTGSGASFDSCLINSGYPCACNRTEGVPDLPFVLCDDGSDCIIPHGDAEFGICSHRCQGDDPSENACQDSGQFGVPAELTGDTGFCGLRAPLGGPPNHCVVICAAKGQNQDCPPGLICDVHPDHNWDPQLPPICIWKPPK